MMIEIVEQFRSSMLNAGLTPPTQIVADGRKHRFSTNGKANDKAGEYRIYPDNIPAGYFMDWRTGVYQNWRIDLRRELTPEEVRTHNKNIEQRKLQEQKEQDAAARKAQEIWNSSQPAISDHPYCMAKKIDPLGLRIYKGSLVIPVTLDKKIHSLQFITKDKQKFFMSNGRVSECYYSIGTSTKVICICEGVATGISIHRSTGHAVVVAFSCGNLPVVSQYIRKKFPDSLILLCADNDPSGLKFANHSAELIKCRVIVPECNIECPERINDFNDMANMYGLEAVKSQINSACSMPVLERCRKPIPLPMSLPDVRPLRPEMLPEAIRDFVMDVSYRQQSPADFIAVTALCAISTVLGRKIRIRPKQNDDWVVTPNLWGAIIGKPSAMKSPCMTAALQPLHDLQDQFSKEYSRELLEYESESQVNDIARQTNKNAVKVKIKSNDRGGALEELQKNVRIISKPIRKRLIINNTSVEKLGELLNENPNGLILVRDELSGWLSDMQKEEFQGDRAFYLESFNGDGRFIYDRIGRGTIEINSCTLSVIGGIQPSKIMPIVRRAMHGISDDGLVQRLQLSVWPDESTEWSWQDQAPNKAAYERYKQVFIDLHRIYTEDIQVPEFLHFTPEAQKLFIEWMEKINKLARSKEIHTSIESHILKMPKTISSLALLFELIDGGRESVGVRATLMAIEWAEYLLDHVKRFYSGGTQAGIVGAHLILKRKEKLPGSFTAREVYRKQWVGLDNVESTIEAIQCLVDHNYLVAESTGNPDAVGRPTIIYKWIN